MKKQATILFVLCVSLASLTATAYGQVSVSGQLRQWGAWVPMTCHTEISARIVRKPDWENDGDKPAWFIQFKTSGRTLGFSFITSDTRDQGMAKIVTGPMDATTAGPNGDLDAMTRGNGVIQFKLTNPNTIWVDVGYVRPVNADGTNASTLYEGCTSTRVMVDNFCDRNPRNGCGNYKKPGDKTPNKPQSNQSQIPSPSPSDLTGLKKQYIELLQQGQSHFGNSAQIKYSLSPDGQLRIDSGSTGQTALVDFKWFYPEAVTINGGSDVRFDSFLFWDEDGKRRVDGAGRPVPGVYVWWSGSYFEQAKKLLASIKSAIWSSGAPAGGELDDLKKRYIALLEANKVRVNADQFRFSLTSDGQFQMDYRDQNGPVSCKLNFKWLMPERATYSDGKAWNLESWYQTDDQKNFVNDAGQPVSSQNSLRCGFQRFGVILETQRYIDEEKNLLQQIRQMSRNGLSAPVSNAEAIKQKILANLREHGNRVPPDSTLSQAELYTEVAGDQDGKSILWKTGTVDRKNEYSANISFENLAKSTFFPGKTNPRFGRLVVTSINCVSRSSSGSRSQCFALDYDAGPNNQYFDELKGSAAQLAGGTQASTPTGTNSTPGNSSAATNDSSSSRAVPKVSEPIDIGSSCESWDAAFRQHMKGPYKANYEAAILAGERILSSCTDPAYADMQNYLRVTLPRLRTRAATVP